MENEPNPEEETVPHIECEHCRQPVPINDDTTYVYAFISPKDYRYSFAATQCDKFECGQHNYNFVDVEDIMALDGVIPDNIRLYNTIEDMAEVYHLDPGHARQFLVEQRKGIDHGTPPVVPQEAVEVQGVTYEERMLAFIAYVEPYEFSTRLYYRDARGE